MTAKSSATGGSLIEESIRLIMSSFTEVVPAEAQLHLMKAQRELLLALTVVVEHNLSRSVGNPRADRKRRTTTKRKRPSKVTIS